MMDWGLQARLHASDQILFFPRHPRSGSMSTPNLDIGGVTGTSRR